MTCGSPTSGTPDRTALVAWRALAPPHRTVGLGSPRLCTPRCLLLVSRRGRPGCSTSCLSPTPRSPTPASWPTSLWHSSASACWYARRSPRTSITIWVDGLIAALGVAALEATVVIGPIIHASTGNFGAVATNIAYPIEDLVLVTMVIAGLCGARMATGAPLVDPGCRPCGIRRCGQYLRPPRGHRVPMSLERRWTACG